jgi:hypothetical protein
MTNRAENNNSFRGIGFTGLLQIAFIVLKLCHVIDWSWLWVLSPTWISIILFVLVIVVVAWLTSR